MLLFCCDSGGPVRAKHRSSSCAGPRQSEASFLPIGGSDKNLQNEPTNTDNDNNGNGCQHKFYENKERWLQRTSLLACLDIAGDAEDLKEDLPDSWLMWFDETKSQKFALGCLVCRAAKLKSPWGMATVGQDAKNSSSLHGGNLNRHANSLEHRLATIEYVRQRGVAVSSAGVVEKFAPTEDCFLTVLQHVKSTGGLDESGDGSSGAPHARKVKQMMWCLAEAVWRVDRASLKAAEVIALFRDERAGHLLLRAACVGDDLILRHMLLGIKPRFGTGSLEITAATTEVLKRATNGLWSKPVRDRRIKDRPELVVDQEMLDHMCAKVRIIASDSAADELAAARMSSAGPDAIFQNVEAVLRDKAHASRRCLSRPWHADKEIHDVLEFFIRHKHSMVQKISHSPDLRRIFTK